jgi:hypothetical protein
MSEATAFRVRAPHVILGVAVYLALLVVWAPASLVGWVLPRASGEALWLDEPTGSVWSGTATTFWAKVGGGAEPLGHVTWRWRPGDLLAGRLAYALELRGAEVDARVLVRVGAGGGELRSFHAAAPARFLGEWSADLKAWQPGGRLAVASEEIVFAGGRVTGKATLRWQDAVSALARQPLGTYRADLDGNDRNVRFRVATEAGALQLQGVGTWAPSGGLKFDGTARSGGDGAFDGLLTLIGPASPDGSRVVRIGR